MRVGKFIVVEGIDGAGKTTLALSLVDALKGIGNKVIYTREPGGSKVSEQIRNIILSNEGKDLSIRVETLLFLASRAANISKTIIPALENGIDVICDRFSISTNVYQGHVRSPKIINGIRSANNFSIDDAHPDLVIYLKLDPKEALRRNMEGKGDKNSWNWLDNQPLDFYQKVSNGYDEEISLLKNKAITLNATQTREELVNEAMNKILDFFSWKK